MSSFLVDVPSLLSLNYISQNVSSPKKDLRDGSFGPPATPSSLSSYAGGLAETYQHNRARARRSWSAEAWARRQVTGGEVGATSKSRLWARLSAGFEQAWAYCNGTAYDTSRVNRVCAEHSPGADCSHNAPGRDALYCRDQYDDCRLTRRALYHAPE